MVTTENGMTFGIPEPSFPDLIGESSFFSKHLDCPVEPDNDGSSKVGSTFERMIS